MPKKKILFIVGSPNQTTQMHQIERHLQSDFDCFFTQIFDTNPLIRFAVSSGLLDKTIMGGEFRKRADNYLKANNLQNDYALSVYGNTYDLVVICTDILVPKKLRSIKTVWVQEGMTDPFSKWAKFVKKANLPSYLSMNTALNGTGNICDIYCAASEGYKKHFAEHGTHATKIAVTGIPNYDDIHSFLYNDFPYKNYVLAATSDIREVLGKDNRKKFIEEVTRIANGRRIIFKLHPNEKGERAIKEIRKYAPADSLIFTDGNTNHMIANCDELITQYSTVVYIGIVLGKKVHSYFDIDELKRLTPLQNDGSSSKTIAEICRNYISFKGTGTEFLRQYEFKASTFAA